MLTPATTTRNLLFAAIGFLLTLAPYSGIALEKGDILVRLRAIAIVPTDDGVGIAPDLLSTGLEAQSAAVPELDFTYMVTDSIGIELILATSKHDFDGVGVTLGGLGKMAEAWLLPPTLLAQYHFNLGSKFRPYIGAGLNYTLTYGENADAALEAILGPTSISADHSFGWAVQIGADYEFNDKWFVNFDVKYIDLSLDLRLNSGGTLRTLEVEIDPVIVGIGIGYRF